MNGALLLDHEAPIRRHDLKCVADLDRLCRPIGEHTAFDRTDADLELAVAGEAAARAADRVGAAYLLAVDGGAHGEELARPEGEAFAIRRRDVERDRHRARSLGAYALDGEFLKTEC